MPEDFPVELDLQAVPPKGPGPAEIGDVELLESVNLFGTELHGPQCELIAFVEAADRVQEYRGG